MLSSLAIVGLLLSSGVAYAHSPAQPRMVGSQWAVYEQSTLPNGNLLFSPTHADTIDSGGVQFEMPDATAASPAWANYMLDTFKTSLTETNSITAVINVVASSPAALFAGDTFGGQNLAQPAFVRLFIQSNLPSDGSATCVGGNKNVDNYWWADTSSYTFTPGSSPGSVTLSASLDPAGWSSICGQSGSFDVAGFDSAISDVHIVGLSFGSGYFFASGVGVDGTTGTATFQLLSYTIS